MASKELTAYEKALTWSEAHLLSQSAAKATQQQNYAAARVACDELTKALDKIAAHHAAVALNEGRGSR